MRKGCFVCGITLAFFGLVLFVFLPVVNWIVYPWLEKLVILKYTDLKPENTDVWNAWVSDSHMNEDILIRIIFTQIEPSKEIPIYLDYTVWSVTNADDLANGALPRYK